MYVLKRCISVGQIVFELVCETLPLILCVVEDETWINLTTLTLSFSVIGLLLCRGGDAIEEN
jgi:hypothetical protein